MPVPDARLNSDLRLIFSRIQAAVVSQYDQADDNKNTRYTCISAFIFLRFFVPAILNPRLFLLVPGPPDPRAQRTLTLVAKSLQGLANFSSFGQKEPWMQPMNRVVEECSQGLVDFLHYVSTPVDPVAHRQEWTSPNAAAYVVPNRLRYALPPLIREAIPTLPHLIDLPKELGSLARRLARTDSAAGEGHVHRALTPTPSSADRSVTASQAFQDLVRASIDVEKEARRRAGALAGPPIVATSPEGTRRGDTRQRGLDSRSAIADEYVDLRSRSTLRTPRALDHLRSTSSDQEEPESDESTGVRRRPAGSSLRQTHRSFTISGPGTETVTLGNGTFPGRSFANEDLSALATLGSVDDIFAAGTSPPTDLQAGTRTLPRGGSARLSPGIELDDTRSQRLLRAPETLWPAEQSAAVVDSNPSPRTRVDGRTPRPAPLSSRAGSADSDSLPLQPAMASVRITQETVTTVTYLSEPLSLGRLDPSTSTDQVYLSPAADELGAVFETSFGHSAFAEPLLGALRSESSASASASASSYGWADGWTGFSAAPPSASVLTSRAPTNSTNLASPVVSSSASPAEPQPADERVMRRTSSTGMASFLSLNRKSTTVGGTAPARASRDGARVSFSGSSSSSSTWSRDVRSGAGDGTTGNGAETGGGGGFLGRALGRKGLR